ncbi:MAG: hypothetical protein KatS3mg105_4106 [Gemmatales bacterium]|nr:MAG: hypothetical protein KatS3mg105_4106 [Gemmatales bacterium]
MANKMAANEQPSSVGEFPPYSGFQAAEISESKSIREIEFFKKNSKVWEKLQVRKKSTSRKKVCSLAESLVSSTSYNFGCHSIRVDTFRKVVIIHLDGQDWQSFNHPRLRK